MPALASLQQRTIPPQGVVSTSAACKYPLPRAVDVVPRETTHSTREPRRTTLQRNHRFVTPVSAPLVRQAEQVDATPIQIWEGTVINVAEDSMQVTLTQMMGDDNRHTAEIDLEWVTEQDRSLVRPGAVFYLMLYKRTTRGSITNSQELRFRRFPAWSKTQLRQVERDAAMLRANMRPLPMAE